MNGAMHGGDADLWARARVGDPEAFGLLFDRHADSVYRYAHVKTSDAGAAEEIVSIVFSEVWRQRDRIEPMDGSLRPWLIAVARNQTNRLHRKRLRAAEATRVLRPDRGGSDHSDHADQVAEAVDASGRLSEVMEEIERLPLASRETLVLHVWGQLTHEQIAEELGVSTGTVKSRLNRARARLGGGGQEDVPGTVVDLHGNSMKGDDDA